MTTLVTLLSTLAHHFAHAASISLLNNLNASSLHGQVAVFETNPVGQWNRSKQQLITWTLDQRRQEQLERQSREHRRIRPHRRRLQQPPQQAEGSRLSIKTDNGYYVRYVQATRQHHPHHRSGGQEVEQSNTVHTRSHCHNQLQEGRNDDEKNIMYCIKNYLMY